ncbi:MAG: DUF2332 domain-containing protein [Chloroflexia bacterium]
MPDHAQPNRAERLVRQFVGFAGGDRDDASPLYRQLALGVSEDPEMLALAGRATSEPAAYLFMGAVHYLLLQGARHPLIAFYPSLTPSPLPPADAYRVFRDFCFAHVPAITRLIQTRRVQTNEVRRCAMLLPAFGIVGERAGGRQLAVVEIGASAGLNLLWDRLGYDYGRGRRYGDPGAAVQLTCELRGDLQPPFPDVFPPVASRLGIDLHPVDVRDPDATAWLRALIWPEHSARVELLERALAVVRRDPPEIRAGDALDLLPGIMDSVPEGALLSIFHSFTVNQFSDEGRSRLAAILADYGSKRDLCCISIEGHRITYPQLRLLSYAGGVETERLLATCSGHGRWMEWLVVGG